MQFLYKNRSIFNIRLIVILIALAFCACGNSQAEGENRRQETENKDAAVTVTVEKAVAREVPAFIQATGSLTADETSNIAPKVAGKVVNIYANVGEFVASVSTIAKLDDNDARLRVAEAEASVKQAQAAVRQAASGASS